MTRIQGQVSSNSHLQMMNRITNSKATTHLTGSSSRKMLESLQLIQLVNSNRCSPTLLPHRRHLGLCKLLRESAVHLEEQYLLVAQHSPLKFLMPACLEEIKRKQLKDILMLICSADKSLNSSRKTLISQPCKCRSKNTHRWNPLTMVEYSLKTSALMRTLSLKLNIKTFTVLLSVPITIHRCHNNLKAQ